MSKGGIRSNRAGERAGKPGERAPDAKTEADADRIGPHAAFARGAALLGDGEGEPRVDPRRALALQSALGNHQFSRLVAARRPHGAGPVVFRKPAEGFAGEPDRDAEQRALSRLEGGAPLPASLRSALRDVVALDLDEVRIHTDERAAATARDLGARALTVEHDISFAAGEYAPHTPDGLQLLVHELKHVEQQARGLRPGTIAGRAIGDPHDPLEREADAAAHRVSVGPPPPSAATPAPAQASARPRRAVRGASPVIMRQPRADAAGDRIEVIADPAKHKLRVVRVDKNGRIVAGLAEITPPKGESLEEAKVEAKLHETSRLTDDRGTYKIKLPPRYTAITNPKETVDLKQTTVEEVARKEADRQQVEEFLAAQDAEFGTNLALLYATDLADEEKVAALMKTEGYQQFAQKKADKKYWTEVKRLMELDRESIKEGYLAGDVVLSDKEADDTWVDRELEKPRDDKTDRDKPHMSALQQWEARNRAWVEERLYVQGKRAQARGFAGEQARIMAHRVEPGASSSAAEKQEAREWAALAGHDLADDDDVARQINAQVREHKGDLLELATKEAAWAVMHNGPDSPEARRWRTIVNAHGTAMKAGGFDQPWRPNAAREARENAEDSAIRQQFAQMFPGFEEGLSVKEMREILRRGRSRAQLSSWERDHLDKHGTLPNEVTDERGILKGYKLYSYEELGLGGGVGQVTEEIVDLGGKRVSINKTVTLTPAVAFFEDLARSLPYMSTAISALEALTGQSMQLRDVYSESGRELSFGERFEAILNGIPAGGPFGKVAHYAGRIMLAKAALEVTTGMDLSGPGIDAIIAGKPRWLTADERAQRAIHGAAMHIAYSAIGVIEGTVANRGAINKTFKAGPERWRDPGHAPNASGGGEFATTGRRVVDKATRFAEILLTSGMKPGAPQLVYHEGAPLVAEMHEGAAPARPRDAGGEPTPASTPTVQREVEGDAQGKAPKARYRREPTPAERGQAWDQTEAMAAYWQERGITPPKFQASMDLPTSWIHEKAGSPTEVRIINMGYNLAPNRDLASVPLPHRANAALSPRAAVGHEGGHYEAFVADKVHPTHEETQASLRGAIHHADSRADVDWLVRDAAARLGEYEQGTPVPGREELRSRWQRPTLVMPPGLWLDAIDFRAVAPHRAGLATSATPAAAGIGDLVIREVEPPRRGGPPRKAAEPADKAGQSPRSAAEEAQDAFRRAGERLAKPAPKNQPRQPAPPPERAQVARPQPPKEAPAPAQARPQPARSADAPRGHEPPPLVKLSPTERADLDAKIAAACKKLPYLSKQLELSRSKIIFFMKRIEAGEPDPQPSVVNNELTDGHHRLIASMIVGKPVEPIFRSQDPAMRQLSKAAHEMAVRIAEVFGTPPPGKDRPLRPIKNADFVLTD
ncbi:eCIS core domain-containing protein [Nannocystis punicea]|uniref:DUF4157 domain-containing protein n=1 Tax=Nannocystis punicea TaxID=2995304 RepID=A0ABY7GVQ2_9BACT|nr:DUF4157 domain-containing protein [Nannocystis poenicansa]WAS91049.1 DUF4157 domain-containing protein [Nannocystis poenicansa]